MVYKNLLKKKINLSEFQRVVACVAYKSCAKDLTITQHQNAIYNCFHAKGDNASQFQLLIDGTNICYKNMFYMKRLTVLGLQTINLLANILLSQSIVLI